MGAVWATSGPFPATAIHNTMNLIKRMNDILFGPWQQPCGLYRLVGWRGLIKSRRVGIVVACNYGFSCQAFPNCQQAVGGFMR